MVRGFCLFLILHLAGFFPAQATDSVALEYKKLEYNRTSLVIPVTFMAVGALMEDNRSGSFKNKIKEERNRRMPGFRNHLDDVAQFIPFVALYGFEVGGMKPRTDIYNRTAIMVKAQVLNLGMVYLLKNCIDAKRPDGTALSFPSGHTANVFAGAALLTAEYGQDQRWVPYMAYGIASSVGAMRIANNKHYLSDVLFGAGLGILSVKLAYWTHQYQWNKTKTKTDPFLGAVY